MKINELLNEGATVKTGYIGTANVLRSISDLLKKGKKIVLSIAGKKTAIRSASVLNKEIEVYSPPTRARKQMPAKIKLPVDGQYSLEYNEDTKQFELKSDRVFKDPVTGLKTKGIS